MLMNVTFVFQEWHIPSSSEFKKLHETKTKIF